MNHGRLLFAFVLLACGAACDVGAIEADDGAGGGASPDGGADVTPAGRFHPLGFAAAEQHGPQLNLQTQECRTCHAADLTGGASMGAPSCDGCHTPVAEPAAWRSDCTFCHGSDDNTTGAPPRDIDVGSADISFAAHSAHVVDGIASASDCTECHAKPVDLLSEGHVFDSTPAAAEVSFAGGLAAAASYDGDTCSNNYCHGDGRGSNGTVAVNGGPLECSGCHSTSGAGMSGEHSRHINGENLECSECHSTVASPAQAIIAPSLHVDGARQVDFSGPGTYNAANRSCSGLGGGCHGTETW